jgi:hypothetical protein
MLITVASWHVESLVNHDRFIGTQPSASVFWHVQRHGDINVTYGFFLAGPFLTQASPPAHDVQFASLSAAFTFCGPMAFA